MFKQAIERIKQDLPDRFKIMVDDSLALVVMRVQNDGLRADGNKFSSYSITPVPTFFYDKLAKRKNATAKLEKFAKEKKYISYSDFRTLVGSRTDIKDFTMTGVMWASLHSFDVISDEGGVETYLGFTDSEVAKRYIYNSEREGIQLADLSEEEVDMLGDSINEWIFEQIKIDI